MKIALDSIVSRTRELSATEVEAELVMMDLEKGKYYGLNAVATHIWKLLDEPHAVRSLCSALRDAFDVGEAECEADVLAFLETLRKADMIAVQTG